MQYMINLTKNQLLVLDENMSLNSHISTILTQEHM